MFGWINDCCESLVVSKFGLDKWHEIKAEADCKIHDGGFIRHQYYSDESSVDLVVATSKVLGIPVDAVLEAFGEYFMEFTRNAGYDSMLSCQGSNLKLWLSNLNALHDHLQDTLPRGRFPEFWCGEDEEGSILLHYYSERGSLFAPFVVGLVTEVARYHFRLIVQLDRLQTQGENNAKFTTWKISTADPSLKHKLIENVGWIVDANDVEDTLRQVDIKDAAIAAGCPFHAMESKTVRIDESGSEKFWRRASPMAHISSDVQKEYDNKVLVDRDQHQNGLSTQKNHPLHVPSSQSSKTTTTTTTTTKMDTTTITKTQSDTQTNFMSNDNMKEIFPFHLVLDSNFIILQHGKDLLRLIGSPSKTLVNTYAYEVFEIKRPVLGSWDWTVLDQFQEQTFYLLAGKGVHLKAHFINLSSEPKHVLVTLSPDVKNVKQLQDMKLNMSDLPVHTFQRDAIFLGEHLLSGIKSSHKLDKLSRKLVNEHNLSNTLLYSMLPRDVAKILRNGKPFEPSFHDDVTLFFSDVVGFTDMCSELPPWDIIDMLNRLYNVMDLLAEKFHLYKVETIGDAYMCCSGLLEPNKYHAEDVVNFAIAARRCVSLVKSPLTNKPIRMRIGIHTGSCMSGVVGTLTPRYCLFGDMVNTTSRHESTGEPQKIHCSRVTYEHLTRSTENQGYYNFSPRGLVDMKGKGLLHTYWLDSAGEKNPFVNSTELKKIVAEVQDMLESKTWRKRRYFHRNNSDVSNMESIAALVTSEDFSSDDNTETNEKGLNDEGVSYHEGDGVINRIQDGSLGRSIMNIDTSDDLLDNIDARPIRWTSETKSVSSESDVVGASYHSPETNDTSLDVHHSPKPTSSSTITNASKRLSIRTPSTKKNASHSKQDSDSHVNLQKKKVAMHVPNMEKKKDGRSKNVFQRLYEQSFKKSNTSNTKMSSKRTSSSFRDSTRRSDSRTKGTSQDENRVYVHSKRWR